MYEKVPNELKECPNWVCFRLEDDPKRPEKLKKMPINPRTGGRAMSNTPSTWCDFNTALNALDKFGCDGVGFMFSGSPFFGVDIDDALGELQEYIRGEENFLSEFIDTLQSYAEVSPSGKGIHIICRGILPSGRRKNGRFEMYDAGRFFTVTGEACAEYADIVDCTESIKALHQKYLEPAAKSQHTPEVHVEYAAPATAAEIVELASRAKNGAKFVALYSGDISGYPSQSEADMALCNLLAYWTRRDAELMDVIYRSSGLFRTKWDRNQSGSTYGTLTIQKAIAECVNVYEPGHGDEEFRVNIGSQKQKLYTMDDMGNAQRFIDLFGEETRYNYIAKKWLYWDERRWRFDDDGAAERMADRAVDAMKAEAKVYEMQDNNDILKAFNKHIKSSRSNKSKGNMLREAQHLLPIMPESLDRHPYALNTPSGIVSLRSGQTVPHDKKYLITKISGSDCAESADCPLWEKFIKEIFGGDTDLIRYVKKAVGYSLTGSVQEQCMFILLGDGHNGKSTFLEVLRAVFGDYCSNIQAETIMVKNGMGSGINSDIARLNKVRLVTSSEPNEGVRLNEGLIKQLTGGDPVTARKLFENEFEFHPEFKLWLAANHKPIVRGTDGGIWRRLHIIPFDVKISPDKADKQLPQKLREEYPAILRWAVEGCLLWAHEGLEMPKAVYDAAKEYRREMDVVSAFIEDRCEVREGAYVKASELYGAYSNWCDADNEYKMSNTKFGSEIAKKFQKVKRDAGMFYIGLSLY